MNTCPHCGHEIPTPVYTNNLNTLGQPLNNAGAVQTFHITPANLTACAPTVFPLSQSVQINFNNGCAGYVPTFTVQL